MKLKKETVFFDNLLKNITLIATVITTVAVNPLVLANDNEQLKKTPKTLSLNAAGYDFKRFEALFSGKVTKRVLK